MSTLTILSVAHPLVPTGARAVGGAEQILAAIDRALVAAGHRSIVIGAHGSEVAGALVELPPTPQPLTNESWVSAHVACRAAIRDTLASEHVDVVHMHGTDFHSYVPAPGPPVLVTLHMPFDWYPHHIFDIDRPRTYLHGVSRTQHAAAPETTILLDPIENGVDLALFHPVLGHGDYALTLCRICPEKAPHLALDAATRAGVPLVLAGEVHGFAEHRRYFHDEIEPRLRPPHRFVGPVVGEAKARLIAGARCLIVPSQIAETSSLVTMEALACGTPVVGFRRGALVELVDDGRTGQLVDDLDALAHAIAGADRFDRRRCRAVAEERCSRDRMCERYLARYEQLAHARPASPRATVDVVDRGGLEELAQPWTALWSHASATIFQHPAWCLAWCRHLLRGSVEAIAVRRGAQLDALLPLFRWRDGDDEVLSFIGGGLSDYHDILHTPGVALDEVARALNALRWDRLELSELPDGAAMLQMRIDGIEECVRQDPCTMLTLTTEPPLANLPRGLRREIGYQRRRAEREVGIETACLPVADIVSSLARVHQARWERRGEDGILPTADRRAFLDEVVRSLAATDQAFGVGVRFGGELAAACLVFLDRHAARFYAQGHDPVYQRRSPGFLAVAGAIEEAHRRGVRELDFLRGDEPYKYQLGAKNHVYLHRRVIRRVTPRSASARR